MTRDEILKLEGRELDASVAIGLLGWRWVLPGGEHCAILIPPDIVKDVKQECCFEKVPDGAKIIGDPHAGVPELSGTWEGMRLVIEAMAAKGYDCSVSISHRFIGPMRFRAQIYNHKTGHQAFAETAPRAVCLAALLAIGGDDVAR